MKKLFYTIVLILSIGILAVSCQKNDPANQSIIGTWKVVSYAGDYDEIQVGGTFTFSESTFTVAYGSNSYTGPYYRNGQNLNLDGEMLTIVSLTSSTMELKLEGEIIKLIKV